MMLSVQRALERYPTLLGNDVEISLNSLELCV